MLGNDKKNAFYLREYFDSFLKLNKKTKQKIRELLIAITVGFEPQVPINDDFNRISIDSGKLKEIT